MNVCAKFPDNPCNTCQDISLTITNVNLIVAIGWKNRGSPKSERFILWGPWISARNVVAIQSRFVEIATLNMTEKMFSSPLRFEVYELETGQKTWCVLILHVSPHFTCTLSVGGSKDELSSSYNSSNCAAVIGNHSFLPRCCFWRRWTSSAVRPKLAGGSLVQNNKRRTCLVSLVKDCRTFPLLPSSYGFPWHPLLY